MTLRTVANANAARVLLAVTLATLLSLLAFAIDTQAKSPSESTTPGLSILETTANGMVLELRVPPVRLATQTISGTQFTKVSLDDTYQWTEAIGQPMLPVYRSLIGIPDRSTIQVEVVEVEQEQFDGAFTVYPVPEFVLSQQPEPGQRLVDPPNPVPTSIEPRFTMDREFYARDALYPAPWVEVTGKSIMRDQVVARLQFYPVHANPARGELWVAQRIVVRLIFDGVGKSLNQGSGPSSHGADPLAPRNNSFDEALSSTLLNYTQALPWRVPRDQAEVMVSKSPSVAQPGATSADVERLRIEVIDSGWYEITYGGLIAAGAAVDTMDPRTFRMQHGGDDVAIQVTGAGDGRFDASDVIRFYAQQVDSIYTWRNVYWLSYGGTTGPRVGGRNVDPALGGAVPPNFVTTERFEESAYYQSELPREGFEVDRWYWTYTYFRNRGAIISRTVTFTLGIPSAVPQEATLQVNLRGGTSTFLQNPDHYARIFLNGQQVGESYWDSYNEVIETFSFDGSLLRPGPNRFTLNSPGGLPGVTDDAAFLNAFELTYHQSYTAVADQLQFSATGPGRRLLTIDGFTTSDIVVLDITDPLKVTQLTGFTVGATGAGTYQVQLSDSLPDTTRHYLAVARAHIQSAVAIVADSPGNLRAPAVGADYLIITHADFLSAAEALAEHRRSKGFTPLVIDVQDIYDEFSQGLLTPVAIRDFLAYAYAEWPDPAPAYVLLLGDGTYDFKDYLGYGAQTYIPVLLDTVDPFIGETASDNRYVTIVGSDPLPDMHIGRLPANTLGEAWTMVNKVIDYETSPPPGDWRLKTLFVADNPDTAGNFPYLSNEVADSMVPAPPYQVQKIYYGTNYTDILATRQAVRSAIDNGALLVNYVGHSSITWWGAEIFLGINDVPLLNNDSRLPVMLPMTCYDGYFHSPLISSLGETIVRAGGRGAVASWSATGQGVATGHDQMHRGFFDAIFMSGVRHLGPATLAGKLQLYQNDQRFVDLVDTYGLLGDPALELLLPEADLTLEMTVTPEGPVQQGDAITYTLTYANSSLGPVPNAVLTTAIPSALSNVVFESSDADVALRSGTRYVWDLGPLAIGEGGQIRLSGRVPDTLTSLDAPYSAGSRVVSVWKESNLANNKGGPLSVPVLPSDLQISLEGPTEGLAPGAPVAFKITYRNNGPAHATTPRIQFPIGDWLSEPAFNFAGPPPTSIEGEALAWDLPTLAPGAEGTIKVRGFLNPDLSADHWPVQAQAAIETPWLDDQPANNHSQALELSVYVLDVYEPDNAPEAATLLPVPGASAGHSESWAGDRDWFRFQAVAGTTYQIRVNNLSPGGDTVLTLTDAQGNVIAQNNDYVAGSGWSGLDWRAPASQDSFIEVRGAPNSAPGFRYDLRITVVSAHIYLPLIAAP